MAPLCVWLGAWLADPAPRYRGAHRRAVLCDLPGSSAVMSLSAFATYYFMGETLTAAKVFPCIFLFEAMTWPLLEVRGWLALRRCHGVMARLGLRKPHPSAHDPCTTHAKA